MLDAQVKFNAHSLCCAQVKISVQPNILRWGSFQFSFIFLAIRAPNAAGTINICVCPLVADNLKEGLSRSPRHCTKRPVERHPTATETAARNDVEPF